MPDRVRILIVEDSPTQAKKLQLLLESQRFEVVVAGDGHQGWKCFLSQAFDLVISDVAMPHLNGYELCERIRSCPDKQQVPVILLTSRGQPPDRLRGLEAGANLFITKPYQEEPLLKQITKLLASSKHQPAIL